MKKGTLKTKSWMAIQSGKVSAEGGGGGGRSGERGEGENILFMWSGWLRSNAFIYFLFI